MKTTSKKVAPWAVGLLCVVMIAGLRAVGQGYGAPPRNDQAKPDKTLTSHPPAYNRASGIVGLNVRNHKDERLGEIQDVVFDLQSERVAYVVMNTGTGILARGKLLAVPLSAFTISPDQKHLILRAEKAKVEAALGFDRENWPSVSNPSWGAEPFWEKDKDSLPTGTESSDKPVNPKLEPKLEQKP